jgi:hypothetical protein
MLNAYIFSCYTECAMLKVIMLSVDMLNVISLSVYMVSVIMLGVIMPIVMASVRVQCYKTFYICYLRTFLIS